LISSCVAAQLAASQEGLSSMKLVTCNIFIEIDRNQGYLPSIDNMNLGLHMLHFLQLSKFVPVLN
jgi:hypothetical protein